MEDQFLSSAIVDSHGQTFTRIENTNKDEEESIAESEDDEIITKCNHYGPSGLEYYQKQFLHEHDHNDTNRKDEDHYSEYSQTEYEKHNQGSSSSQHSEESEENIKEKVIKNISRIIDSISFLFDEEEEVEETAKVLSDVNGEYNRTRRSNTGGKFRIGPSPLSKNNIHSIHDHKPGQLKLYIGNDKHDNSKMALLAYLSAFTEQIDKMEIDLNFIQTLLNFGIDINECDDAGQTALHAFVRDWHPDVVRFAIKNKAEVNIQDEFGRSPLHLAAALNCAEIAQILTDAGADPNIETFNEAQTPVHFASKYDSLDVLKVLIHHGGSLMKRDHKNRAVLSLAAERGSELTTAFLLEMGIPAAMSDIYGHSTLSYIIEKIPNLASTALEQYEEKLMKRNITKLYLNALESDCSPNALNVCRSPLTKSPLEVITLYKDFELIMHPVIQATINVKWKLFGYKDALFQLFLSLIYLIIWIPLNYLVDVNHHNYKRHSDHEEGFIITLEVFSVLLSVYFLARDLRLFRRAVNDHQEWIDRKRQQVQAKFLHCHPCWPGERELVNTEYDSILLVPGLSRNLLFWFIYEWINIIFLSACIITRVLAALHIDTVPLFITSKIVRSLKLGYASLRIIKAMVRFRFVSIFLRVASHAGTSFIQIVFFYLQFYIPFVALFWLWFGDDHDVLRRSDLHDSFKMTSVSTNNSTSNHTHVHDSLHKLFFLVFTSSFTKESLLPFKELDQIPFIIFMSLFHLFTTIVALSIVIAFIRAKFTIAIKTCESEASLYQATMLLLLEKGLSEKDKFRVDYYYRTKCAPLEVVKPLGRKVGNYHRSLKNLQRIQSCLYKVEEYLKDFESTFRNYTQRNEASGVGKSYNNTLDNVRNLLKQCSNYDSRIKREFKYLTHQNENASSFLPRLLFEKSANETEEKEKEELEEEEEDDIADF